MSILNEIFRAEFVENLYKGSEFLKHSVSHSDAIVGNVVHIPNAGAKPGVEKNRSSFPATATERADMDLTYFVDSYTLDPIRIRNYVEVQTKPSLQSSVMKNGIETIREDVTDETLYSWANTVTIDGTPTALLASSIISTSGADSADNLPHGIATGTRKKLVKNDFKKAMKALNKQNLPKTGRVCVLTADMYDELLEDDAIVSANTLGTGETPLATGSVGVLFGFTIFVRSTVLLYTAAGALKAIGATEVATDLGASIFWHESTVAIADGSTAVYTNVGDGNGDAFSYGAVVSGEKFMGSSRLRADGAGVIVIRQTTGA